MRLKRSPILPPFGERLNDKKTGYSGHTCGNRRSDILPPMKDDLRAGPDDYKQLAERCVELASECSAPTVAEALRALALDYLTRAARLRRRGSIESPVVGVAPMT